MNGLHRRGVPSTHNSWWHTLRTTNGWVASSGRSYGQWVQPVGIAGRAHGNPPHGFEHSRITIPRYAREVAIWLEQVTGLQVRYDQVFPLGRRIEFREDPLFPGQILMQLYKNGVER